MEAGHLIIDMDGTLLDSMPMWQNLGASYLEKKGLNPNLFNPEDYAVLTLNESIIALKKTFKLQDDRDVIKKDFIQIAHQCYRENIPLKNGAKTALSQLSKLGFKMILATAASEELALTCLNRLQVLSYFTRVLSCESIGKNKTFPDIYLQAAAYFEKKPAEIIVIEDALYALRTAHTSGFYTIAISDPSNQRKLAEVKNYANLYCENWLEIERFLSAKKKSLF